MSSSIPVQFPSRRRSPSRSRTSSCPQFRVESLAVSPGYGGKYLPSLIFFPFQQYFLVLPRVNLLELNRRNVILEPLNSQISVPFSCSSILCRTGDLCSSWPKAIATSTEAKSIIRYNLRSGSGTTRRLRLGSRCCSVLVLFHTPEVWTEFTVLYPSRYA